MLGKRIPGLNFPVCKKFKPKILNGQLCYQVDVNSFKKKKVYNNIMKPELIFLLDYNEEKMLGLDNDPPKASPNNLHENSLWMRRN